MDNDRSSSIKKEDTNYPAYITIFLNTRIIGHTKEIYRPNMTIPTISSNNKSVYFNPLIKLNKSIVETIPKGKSENFVYEQFFNPNLFNSLLIRSQYYPQPKRTLDQASKEGIIDNNIEILLELLFSQNKPFYIDKKRYTCYGYKYKKGSWITESINSNELKKNFYNYYQSNISSLITRSYRYNIPSANIQSMTPNSFMIVPPNQNLSYPYQQYQPYQPYQPYKPIPIETENPIFETFNTYKKNVPEDVLHGPAASEVFGNIVTKKPEPIVPVKPKKTRMTSDKVIALQSKSLANSGNKPDISNINKLNLQYYNTLIKQYLFYSYDGFKKGFINLNYIKCSSIDNVDTLTNIRKGDFNKNKIEPWDILYNDGNGDCLFYAFCQILNSDDYKKYNVPLKNRKDVFDKTPNINYYDKNNNYTVFGLRNIIADFINYTNKGKTLWDFMNNLNTNSNNDDAYIIKNNLDATLNNIRTCVDEKNRNLYGQKPLDNPILYYWGDNTAINILEYIFELKTIIIHKPNHDIDQHIEIYNTSENVSVIDTKTKLLDYLKIEYKNNNNISINIDGYLIKKEFNSNNKYITILTNNSDNNNCNFIKENIYVNNINIIHKISKYDIYRTGNSYTLDNNIYEKYFYLFYHENVHYEAMIFNIRNKPHYVFENMDIYNFHPYIIYMIYIYNYMLINNDISDFYYTSINNFLTVMNDYYINGNKNNRKKMLMPLLGGNPDDADQTINNSKSSSFISSIFKNINNISNNISTSINNKLNEQLDIKPNESNTYVSRYFANPNMSYYIIVDLELFPGDSISLADKKNLACQIQFDNIRKSYADFLGYQYQPSVLNTSIIPPSIDVKSTSSSDKKRTKKISNYNRYNKYNNTRRRY